MNQFEQSKPSAARRVEMAMFRDDVAGFLRAVQEGASFVITASGEAVAELRPPTAEPVTHKPAPEQPRRLVGRLEGKIWMAGDWDTWPEDFIEEMVENPIFPPEKNSK